LVLVSCFTMVFGSAVTVHFHQNLGFNFGGWGGGWGGGVRVLLLLSAGMSLAALVSVRYSNFTGFVLGFSGGLSSRQSSTVSP
jgi:hypothetical protein